MLNRLHIRKVVTKTQRQKAVRNKHSLRAWRLCHEGLLWSKKINIYAVGVILAFTIACQAPPDKPFQKGLKIFSWGISLSQADSLAMRDSTWKKLTYFVKSTGRGEILGLAHQARNYFLEFEGNKGFCKFTYLDSISDFEKLNIELTTAYGAPDFWDNKNLKHESKTWKVGSDLDIQLARTEYQYIMTIEKK